jgi:hypothetical protein
MMMKNEMNFDFNQELNAAELTDVELDSISGGSRTTDIIETVVTILILVL